MLVLLVAEQKIDSTTTEAIVIQNILAITFMIEQADSVKYKELHTELKNNLTLKQDNYPISLAESVHMLTYWKNNTGTQRNRFQGSRNRAGGGRTPQVSFLQDTSGTDKVTPVPG